MKLPSPEPLSALAAALDSVGDRWTLLVVAALLEGPRRFGELQEAIDGLAPNILSARLRALEERRLVLARPYSERPPRMVYELSEGGRELAGALRLLGDWGARRDDAHDLPRHRACGTELQSVWYCPTCDAPVEEPDADDLHYA